MKRLVLAVIAALLAFSQISVAQPGYGGGYPYPRPGYDGSVNVTYGNRGRNGGPYRQGAFFLNQVGFSYGVNSILEMSAARTLFKNLLVVGQDTRNFRSAGTFNLEYSHSVMDFVYIGAILSYMHGTAESTVEAGRKVGFNAFTFMLSTKLDWVDLNWFTFYSKAAFGMSSVSAARESQQLFDWQLSPIGLEVGGALRFFSEVGFGAQGIFQAGARFCF